MREGARQPSGQAAIFPFTSSWWKEAGDDMQKLLMAVAPVLCLSLLAGCETTVPDPAKPVVTGDACGEEDLPLLFWLDPPSREAGEHLSLYPYASAYPGMMEERPGGCIGKIDIMPEEALVTVERLEDGTPYFVIDEAAEPGTIRFEAEFNGERSIYGEFNIVDPVASPLVGYWAQRPEEGECAPESIIRELSFFGDGRFSLTWQPFEAYRDYWGDYTYDASSGMLTFEIKGNNFIPEDRQDGVVRLEGDTLTFVDANPGTKPGVPACSVPFTRKQ